MPSLIEVCNMSLSAVGTRSTISSLTEGTPEANACARWLETIRDMALRSYNWQFARKTVALALVTDAPDNPGFEYTYAAPSDMIKARFIPDGNRGFWGMQIELVNPGSGDIKVIRTDAEDALLVYTARITNPNLWDPLFTNALALMLGAAITIQLTGNVKIRNNLLETGKIALLDAQVADANESGPEVIDPMPDWLAIRDGYYIDLSAEFPNLPWMAYTL